MKKILAIALVAVLTIAVCGIVVNAEEVTLVNHSFDTVYVNDLDNPAVNDGHAKAWTEANPIDDEVNAIRIRGWARVSGGDIEAFGYKVDEGEAIVKEEYEFDRSDVWGAFGVDKEEANGFDITMDLTGVGKGEHTVTVYVKAGGALVEVTNFAFTQKLEATSGGGSEQPASSEKGEDQWLCGAEPSSMSPGWWFNPVGEPDDRYVTVTFTATSNFSGVKGFYYCSNVDNGYTLAHMNVALVKDGNVVADAELASNGDNWAETDFGKTFGPGEYTLRYTCKSGSGVENDCWCVIGVTDVATDVVVEANVNAPAAGSPVLMLIGADAAGSSQEPGGNPTTADAAVIAIAAVACIALAGVVIAKKVR